MPKKFDISQYKFTIGVPTFVLVIISLVSWLVAAETADAKRDERLSSLEKGQEKQEIIQKDTNKGVQKLNVRFGRMDEKLDLLIELRRNGRRR